MRLEKIDKYQIEELTQLSAMQMQLADKTKGINFLLSWQELLNKANTTADTIIEDSMVMLQNNYSVDYIIYVDVVNGNPVVRYNGADIDLTDEMLYGVTNYLKHHKKEFVASRFEREFYEYTPILQMFGVNRIVSFACVPVIMGEELIGFMLSCIELHENMTGNIIFIDRNDLAIFKFALRQMNDTIFRLKARDEINEMNHKLQQSAVTDLLTGLYNRQGFSKKVDDFENLVRAGKRDNICATVIYLDLDNFKFCNDTYGHDVGDEILIAFSRLFERVLGSRGYIVRYGGDEFVMVLPGHGVDEGEKIAKDVYKGIKEANYFIPEIEAVIHRNANVPENRRASCSIGIAGMDIYDQEHVNMALKHADTMLYAIKKNGKSNYMVWTDETEKGCALTE